MCIYTKINNIKYKKYINLILVKFSILFQINYNKELFISISCIKVSNEGVLFVNLLIELNK